MIREVRRNQISEAVMLQRWLIKELSGKLKVKLNILSIECDLATADWLNFLWLTLGEKGTFLNGCFQKVYERKRKKKKKKKKTTCFQSLGLFCHVKNENFILEMSP